MLAALERKGMSQAGTSFRGLLKRLGLDNNRARHILRKFKRAAATPNRCSPSNCFAIKRIHQTRGPRKEAIMHGTYYTKGARSQESSNRKQGIAERYASESAAQVAAHIEIDERYRKRRRSGTVQRRTEILKLAWAIFHGVICDPRDEIGWPTFPDNDLARRFLVAIRSHVRRKGFNNIARVTAPWLSDAERDAIKPKKKYGAVQLGKDLGLTDAVRTELGIHTIWACDVPRSEMRKRKRAKTAARVRAYRARTKAAKIATKTERAITMLRELLAHRPMAVVDILRSAARRGLEKRGATKPGKVLQTAAKRLGIVASKAALSQGWQWALPSPRESQPRKTPYFSRRHPRRLQKPLISSKASCSVTLCTIQEDSDGVTDCRPAPGEAALAYQARSMATPTQTTAVERKKKRWESWMEEGEADSIHMRPAWPARAREGSLDLEILK
jgi:hypothetical protein